MIGFHRLRRLAPYGAATALALLLAACSKQGPNSTLTPNSEYGRAIDFLWDRLLFLGTIVFVLVEAALIYVIWRYRRRDETTRPPQTHGNVKLEILWTLIPAVILVFIAVPTVRTIFRTQAPAPRGALQIEVYGHQWWWEFRYPQYNFVTANEIYIPTGRTVNFALRTKDVLHSFWIPQLAGKRDLIANRTNYIWFTPDSSLMPSVWNGFCTEYCGSSHANMRFRVFTVKPDQFDGWVRLQQAPALFNVAAAAPASAGGAGAVPAAGAVAGAVEGAGRKPSTPVNVPQPSTVSPATASAAPGPAAQAAQVARAAVATPAGTPATPTPAATGSVAAAQAAGYVFPRDKVPAYANPNTPVPAGLTYNPNVRGDAARGQQLFGGAGTCSACHAIAGNPAAVGNVGPNLTHIGSRTTIAAGLYPNDERHLFLWIKNARLMKPGSIMPTLGRGQTDPQLKTKVAGGLDDQQIADLTAYLQALR